MRITVVGLGYVGLATAVLLAQHNRVTAVDISEERVRLVNARLSPIREAGLAAFLSRAELDLTATTDARAAYRGAEFVIVATPTDYDPARNSFDTSSVEGILGDVLSVNPGAAVVIKSTVPTGFTEAMRKRGTDRILFCPEFLSEGKSLEGVLHPSRIVLGVPEGVQAERAADAFAALLLQAAQRKDAPVLRMRPTEAEAVKLFSNAYLALRVGFFNELDAYAEARDLDARAVIEGVCLDPRIGAYYNNPSFGYGGKCLPKDAKQLLADFGGAPCDIVRAIVESNDARKRSIADRILERARCLGVERPLVGVYRLTMKEGSDNFRQSSVLDVVRLLRADGIAFVVYEPLLRENSFEDMPVERDLERFKATSDIIIANRYSHELSDAAEKLYTRDLFARD
ncbi:MAG: nucleotide sugar dehydrogenase [Clostridiales bacterium]|nr:nucleotide sugar dehydrogenase [Clostridiales bacterium]